MPLSVKQLYRLNHRHQTLEFVRAKKREYLPPRRATMTVWEALSFLETLVDDSDPDTALSEHLRSRQATGDALREGGVPVTEFRARVIVGSGSLSFEIVRNLTERLPVMLCPRWVRQRIQPIAIGDVLAYLVAALDVPASAGQVLEIGGADVLSYRDMMLGYARLRGLRRWLIPVPFLTPGHQTVHRAGSDATG